MAGTTAMAGDMADGYRHVLFHRLHQWGGFMDRVQFSIAAEIRRIVDRMADPFGTGPDRGLDWHRQRAADEPECGRWQWRTSNRRVVLDIKSMDDTFFAHVMRFACNKLQHTSRLHMMFEEREIRLSLHGKDIPVTEGTKKHGR